MQHCVRLFTSILAIGMERPCNTQKYTVVYAYKKLISEREINFVSVGMTPDTWFPT